jgi:hypothetical protein
MSGVKVIVDTSYLDKAITDIKSEIEQLAKKEADNMLKEFKTRQGNNEFWINRSGFALKSVTTGVEKDNSNIGIFIENPVDYAEYLEYANNRQNAALEPLINKYQASFFRETENIMKKERKV